jgi:hypothetical protein
MATTLTAPPLSPLASSAEGIMHESWHINAAAEQVAQVTSAQQILNNALQRALAEGLEPPAIAIALRQTSASFSVTDPTPDADKPGAPEFIPKVRVPTDPETAELRTIDTGVEAKRIADRETYVKLGTAPESAIAAGRIALNAEKAKARAQRVDQLLARAVLPAFVSRPLRFGAAILRWNARRTEHDSARADAVWAQELSRHVQIHKNIVWLDPEAHKAKVHADTLQQDANNIFATIERLNGSADQPMPGELQGFLLEKLHQFHKADKLAADAAKDFATISKRSPHATPHILRPREIRLFGTVIFRGHKQKMRIHHPTEKRAVRQLELEERYDHLIGEQRLGKISLPKYAQHVLDRIDQPMPPSPIPPSRTEALINRLFSGAAALAEPAVRPFRSLHQNLRGPAIRSKGSRGPITHKGQLD